MHNRSALHDDGGHGHNPACARLGASNGPLAFAGCPRAHNATTMAASITSVTDAATRPVLASSSGATIVDTDMAFDVDDVGALCIAHALANNEGLVCWPSSTTPDLPRIGAAAAINEYFDRQPTLGAYKGEFEQMLPAHTFIHFECLPDTSDKL